MSPRIAWAFTAVLALVALCLGYLVLRPFDSGPVHRKSIPAAVPPSLVTDTPLLTFTVPSAGLIEGLEVASGLTHLTVPAGDESMWAGNCCSGWRAYFVIAGTLSVVPHGEMSIIRASGNGTPRSVPVNSEIVAGPGDTLVSRNEAPFDAANSGSVPVELWLVDLTTQGNAVPSGWITHAFSGSFNIDLADGAIVFTLHQVTLLKGAAAPAPLNVAAVMAVELVENGAGAMWSSVVSPQPDGTFLNSSGQTLTIHVLTVASASGGDPGGSPRP